MTNEMALEALKWIVHDIEERRAEADSEKHDDFTNGRSLAYFEMSDMIRSRLEALDIVLDDEPAQ